MALTTTAPTTELKHAKHIRFVQLYTSRSYDDQRPKLVAPSKAMTDRLFTKRDEFIEDLDDDDPVLKDEETKDVRKHILSPRLVDAITFTSQVVWANCQKQEGLLGRSDVRLQTAVGMPIAEDGRGHMCVLVMFSPDNIYSNDDAMEYLQFVRQTAMSASIPCLMPPIQQSYETGGHHHKHLPISCVDNSQQQPENFGEGVVARFVSFRQSADEIVFQAQGGIDDFMPEIHVVCLCAILTLFCTRPLCFTFSDFLDFRDCFLDRYMTYGMLRRIASESQCFHRTRKLVLETKRRDPNLRSRKRAQMRLLMKHLMVFGQQSCS